MKVDKLSRFQESKYNKNSNKVLKQRNFLMFLRQIYWKMRSGFSAIVQSKLEKFISVNFTRIIIIVGLFHGLTDKLFWLLLVSETDNRSQTPV